MPKIAARKGGRDGKNAGIPLRKQAPARDSELGDVDEAMGGGKSLERAIGAAIGTR